jgi:putative ABC transport system ATP-binding protein
VIRQEATKPKDLRLSNISTSQQRDPLFSGNPLIIARGLAKYYRQGGASVRVLDAIDLTILRGEFISLMGPRGSGKSTLLHLLGGLERPTAGTLQIGNTNPCLLSDNQLARFRRRKIGFVFQSFNLIPALTVAENVALPLLLEGRRYVSLRDRITSTLEMFSVRHRASCMPSELASDEMQRVAIARALIADPDLILADEPTARLDSGSGSEVLAHLRRAREDRGVTVVVVSNDLGVASNADRAVILRDGHIESDALVKRLSKLR